MLFGFQLFFGVMFAWKFELQDAYFVCFYIVFFEIDFISDKSNVLLISLVARLYYPVFVVLLYG